MSIMRMKFGPSVVVVAWLLIVVGCLSGCSAVEQMRHKSRIRRIQAWVDAAHADPRGATDNPMPFGKLDDVNIRWEVVRAINAAINNEFWHHSRVSRPKLLAVVERLDSTQGRDFDTVPGCLTIVDMLEEVTPTARDYFWFAQIHQAQAAGNIPQLVRRVPPPTGN